MLLFLFILFCSPYTIGDVNICYTSCDGDEDELTECDILTFPCSYCNNGVVGVTCSKLLTY